MERIKSAFPTHSRRFYLEEHLGALLYALFAQLAAQTSPTAGIKTNRRARFDAVTVISVPQYGERVCSIFGCSERAAHARFLS